MKMGSSCFNTKPAKPTKDIKSLKKKSLIKGPSLSGEYWQKIYAKFWDSHFMIFFKQINY